MANEWRIEARKMLRRGLGAEDIAVALQIPQDDVRRLVRALRASGRLRGVLFGRRYRGPVE
ncbi:MAG: hypothetical protein Tp118SUR00d2C21406231_51 [Prokaryotic dsDNA virus sp.]|nr:MAG: hypothetical protein Tp125DCM00d2C40298531_70 [Prokaryotic dsDNA virus sp.]QDP53171.1 MAG: hypothetical protein Tp118SUR00d2C21406231_51 [Prokaryotic dsDNA virus sp.]